MPPSMGLLRDFPMSAFLLIFCVPRPAFSASQLQNSVQQSQSSPATKSSSAKPPAPEQELQQAITNAGNDRAALVRNLEGFLKEYPESPQRVQIYRALVEASMQLRDTARAADYAERIVALSPTDMSITLLAIQLLERNGDEAATRRAVNYATRVFEYVEHGSSDEKSPRISQEEWEQDKIRDKTSLLQLRGRLYLKVKETASAQSDFERSYQLQPNAAAAEQLGGIAESHKDLPLAITEYARAFALAESSASGPSRAAIRKKLGNVWRLSHGSEDGLGEYLLHAFDEITAKTSASPAKKNAEAREPFDFRLRKAPEGTPFPLADQKGKVLAINFWATWCGPCHALAPLFDRVGLQFQRNSKVLFLAADCDEDESLVGPYLAEEKPHTTAVFADGLDRMLGVTAFPTVIVLDGAGKIVFRTEGFQETGFEMALTDAVEHALGTAAAQQ